MSNPHEWVIPVLSADSLNASTKVPVVALALRSSPPWHQQSWMHDVLNTCRSMALPVILLCWKDSPRCSDLMDGLTVAGCILLESHEVATSTRTQHLLQQLWTQVKHNSHKIWGCDPHVRTTIDRLEQDQEQEQEQEQHSHAAKKARVDEGPSTTSSAATPSAPTSSAAQKEPGQWQSGAITHPFLWSDDRQTMHVMPSDLRAFIARERFEGCSIKDIMKTYAVQACKEADIFFDSTKEWAISADDSTLGNSQADAKELIRLHSSSSSAPGGGMGAPTIPASTASDPATSSFPLRQLGPHQFRVTDEGGGVTVHRCELCTVSYIQGPAQEFAEAMALPMCPGPKRTAPLSTIDHVSSTLGTASHPQAATASGSQSSATLSGCVVCDNMVSAHACKGCNTSAHKVVTRYCSRDCQMSHRKVHKQFCTGAHVFHIPRYCEHCRAQTTLGCKVCKMPFCSARCYTTGQVKHERGCGSIPGPAELALLAQLPKSMTLPTIKKYNAPLMFIPRDMQFPGVTPEETSFNLFQLGTDPRSAIREAFPDTRDVKENTIFVEDYVYVMRLLTRPSSSRASVGTS